MPENKANNSTENETIPDFTIDRLGISRYDSPLKVHLESKLGTHG
ncbi:hypothetical protein ACFL5B_04135 [Candidatus Latescibacterota bacterium]